MIRIPVLEELFLSGYALFPGRNHDDRQVRVKFPRGLTVILGSNGLGKTTLVNVLYRLLTGPFDISGITSRDTLGTLSLEPSQMPVPARTMFAQRVPDRARSAYAVLAVRLGDHRLVVERRLSDLQLSRFTVDGSEDFSDESEFQSLICSLAGVWNFGDWILLLRHLVFYFEDRRALVWDPTAQRQVLRFLLLPAETAGRWTQDERAILELDSRFRNLRVIVGRQERNMASNEAMLVNAPEVRAELSSLEQLQDVDRATRERLDNQLVVCDARRDAARLRAMTLDLERERRFRDVERSRLLAIESRFPSKSETARYILAQLMAQEECLVCGNHVAAVANELERRVATQQCVVCGSDLSLADGIQPTKLSDRRLARATTSLAAIEPELADARSALAETSKQYQDVATELVQLDAAVSSRSQRIDFLISRLPREEAAVHQQRADLAALRSTMVAAYEELEERRSRFSAFLDDVRTEMADRTSRIKESFEGYAKGFLLEDCQLRWSPQRDRLGQGGELMEFPAFQLDLSAAGFETLVPRDGPDQVSESQREFIDLAFRMALIDVAGSDGVGTLVIDAPESSLDAVFVSRAASVLMRFATANKMNRLVMASNLVEGQLIPTLLKTAAADASPAELVNLFELAEPTAAVRQLRGEYDRALAKVLGTAARIARARRRRKHE